MTEGIRFTLDVTPALPQRLERLAELADDLWYAWDRSARSLFSRLDPPLWHAVGQSPKAMLQQVDQRRLDQAAEDPVYLTNYSRVLSAYDTYLAQNTRRFSGEGLGADDLIAYFCAEFGFHESLPIYSGGLGILAGDHCKAASDMRVPFFGVGLLYRQGYFTQQIDGDGNQLATYHEADFAALPIQPARDASGAALHVAIELPGRALEVKVWQVKVGHVRLYLLDTDLTSNRPADRAICYRLYGGDRSTRIEQEIVLGVGGVRALAALGLKPTVWHINEGHAAFLVLERARRLIEQPGLSFAAALEAVAVNTVFTTHTAVPAGHDHFSEETIAHYFGDYCRTTGIDVGTLLALGRTQQSGEFNMTALAVRGSRHQNGVSRIHGGVSDRMLKDLWPQISPQDNPIEWVTNGAHVLTFLATEWHDIFERFLGVDWSQRLTDIEYWKRVELIPDSMFWNVREYLKAQMLGLVRYRVRQQLLRNRGSEAHLDRLFRYADPYNPNVLTIGFGRRFATYKRSTLLFRNLDTLREIVSDPKRPVVFVFSGKAHPADTPGQDQIRRVMEVAKMPEFEGRLLLVEGYDLRLARRLVAGVDVWLNNPIHPLEASGTSGMKASMNGTVNLSILDGWWDEAYDGSNGWAIKPASEDYDQDKRDEEEAKTLYELLSDHVIPMYYERDGLAYSPRWVAMAKRAMSTILPQFNAVRMVNEYIAKFYGPAARRGSQYQAAECAAANEIAAWKERVRAAWPGVSMRRVDEPVQRIRFGETVKFEVAVRLNGLATSDVAVELMLTPTTAPERTLPQSMLLTPSGHAGADGEVRYAIELAPELCGKLEYRMRAYPQHALLTHPFEVGLMIWL
jgi:starch phosphorylase